MAKGGPPSKSPRGNTKVMSVPSLELKGGKQNTLTVSLGTLSGEEEEEDGEGEVRDLLNSLLMD